MLKLYKMKNLLFTMLLLVTMPSLLAQVQRPPADKFDQFLQEVYINDGQQFVAPDTDKYAFLRKMYEERIVYSQVAMADIEAKGYPLLSSLPLFSTYNDALVSDTNFNPQTFNPLKYNFHYHSRVAQAFVVDGTNTVITIYPQNFKQ